VTLAELPFVSLRHGLPEALLTGHGQLQRDRRSRPPRPRPGRTADRPGGAPRRAAGKVFSCRRPNSRCSASSPGARCAARSHCRRRPRNCPTATGKALSRRAALDRRPDSATSTRPNAPCAMAWTAATSRRTSRSCKKILKRELGPAAAPYLISDGGSRPRRYRLALRPAAVSYGALENRPLSTGDLA
jgi:hypothetical protein